MPRKLISNEKMLLKSKSSNVGEAKLPSVVAQAPNKLLVHN